MDSCVRLLARCCRPDNADDDARQFAELVAGITDWQRLMDLALRHRVMPLLYERLRTMPSGAIPGDFMEELRRRYIANASRNEHMTRELVKVLDIMSAHGIRAMPIKGPVLAALAYGDISRRMFDDLDILLKVEDVEKAAKELLSLGYEPFIELSEAERKAHVRAGWGWSMHSPGKDYYVELDTGITPEHFSFRADPALLWENTELVTLEERSFHTMFVENLVLLLCVHGTKHLWERLAWIVDVGQLVRRRPDINWHRVLGRARSLGGLRMVLLGLGLCRDVLEMKLPDEVVEAMRRDAAVERLLRRLTGKIRLSEEMASSPLGGLRLHLASRERLRDKTRHVLSLAFTPSYSDWRSLPLPESLFWLYRLIRPFRLIWKAISGALRFPRDVPVL
jgi:hypothetical protein